MKKVIVVGGGPAGLMAADVLCSAGVSVDVYDAMPSVGRKFLLAVAFPCRSRFVFPVSCREDAATLAADGYLWQCSQHPPRRSRRA